MRYETDLLVQIDSYLIVVEAKAGTISMPALRGAPDRARKHISELFVDPAYQSDRLVAALRSEDGHSVLPPSSGINMDKVHQVLRISITLEDFAMLQSNLSSRTTNWLPAGFEPCPTLCLSEFEVVCDVLDAPAELIHYLTRRAELETKIQCVADETDLLAVYLDTAFAINDETLRAGMMMLAGHSKRIDDYYEKRRHGLDAAKPKRRLAPFWHRMLARLGARKPPRWVEAAGILLNVSFDTQLEASEKLRQIAKGVKRKANNNTLILQTGNDGLAFVMFRHKYREERHGQMENAADQLFDSPECRRALVIAIDVDQKDQPYATIGVLARRSL